ncbi:helix-turn-helix domain-containing protein, partial [Klebsiella pneumoniae]
SEGVHCGRPNNVSPEQVQELVSSGLSTNEIQKELGISKATFYSLK